MDKDCIRNGVESQNKVLLVLFSCTWKLRRWDPVDYLYGYTYGYTIVVLDEIIFGNNEGGVGSLAEVQYNQQMHEIVKR